MFRCRRCNLDLIVLLRRRHHHLHQNYLDLMYLRRHQHLQHRRHLSHQPVLRNCEVLPLFARLSQAEQDRSPSQDITSLHPCNLMLRLIPG